MGYTFELSAGQSVYLENLGDQTRVTSSSSSPGQQQQSSSSVQTERWTAAPEAFRVAMGFVIKLYTTQGEQFFHMQGSHLSALPSAPSLAEAQQVQSVAQMPVSMTAMPPMQPMPTMPPMTMGDMQTERGGMSMQMGNMQLSMNPIARAQDNPSSTNPSSVKSSPTSSTNAVENSEQRNFCSQCGVAVKASDRFCASCGHHLG